MDKLFISDEELDTQIKEAQEYHKWAMENEPKAIEVKYLSEKNSLFIKLLNGVSLAIPLRFIPELKNVPKKDIDNVVISPLKEMLSWDEHDIDISLKGIILKSLNIITWVEPIIASNRGRVKSEAKAIAARKNGKKGGRPSGNNKGAVTIIDLSENIPSFAKPAEAGDDTLTPVDEVSFNSGAMVSMSKSNVVGQVGATGIIQNQAGVAEIIKSDNGVLTAYNAQKQKE